MWLVVEFENENFKNPPMSVTSLNWSSINQLTVVVVGEAGGWLPCLSTCAQWHLLKWTSMSVLSEGGHVWTDDSFTQQHQSVAPTANVLARLAVSTHTVSLLLAS